MLKTNFSSNPNIGVIGIANDDVLIIGEGYEYNEKKIKQELGVQKIIETRISGITTPGIFLVWTGEEFLAPDIIETEEKEKLEKEGIKIKVIKTKLTALNNNLLILNGITYCNPDFEEEVIKENKWVPREINEEKLVGSMVGHNGTRGIISPEATDEEIDELEATGITIGVGTVNKGVKFVRSGMIINNKGLLLGGETTGPELQRLTEIFEN